MDLARDRIKDTLAIVLTKKNNRRIFGMPWRNRPFSRFPCQRGNDNRITDLVDAIVPICPPEYRQESLSDVNRSIERRTSSLTFFEEADCCEDDLRIFQNLEVNSANCPGMRSDGASIPITGHKACGEGIERLQPVRPCQGSR